MGGISNIEDVIEFIMAGASAVSIGTGNMVEPSISEKLAGQFKQYMEDNSIESVDELIGAAH